jgi:predicted nucleotidyltransferase
MTMVEEQAIRELSDRIAREFNPERIILFGSYAYGRVDPDSDVDLLVMLQFEGKSFWKSLEILNRVNPQFPVDLIARRPDDTARRYVEGDPLIREALDRGKVLYERDGQGVGRQGARRLSDRWPRTAGNRGP